MNSVVWCHTSNTSKARCLLNLFYVHHRVSAQHQTYQTILPDLQEGVIWGTTAFLFPIFFSLDIFPFIIRVYFTVNIDNFQTYPSSSVGTNALIKIWVGSIWFRHVHLDTTSLHLCFAPVWNLGVVCPSGGLQATTIHPLKTLQDKITSGCCRFGHFIFIIFCDSQSPFDSIVPSANSWVMATWVTWGQLIDK